MKQKKKNDETFDITKYQEVKDEELIEITDPKLIASISNTLPPLIDASVRTAVMIDLKAKNLYQAFYPEGTSLLRSKDTPNAFLGWTTDRKHQARWTPVDISKNANYANILSNTMNIASLIVGQYYMSVIDKKLKRIETGVLQIQTFLDNEFTAEVHSVFLAITTIINHKEEILEDDLERSQRLQQLKSLKTQTTKLFKQISLKIKGSFNELINKKHPLKEFEIMTVDLGQQIKSRNFILDLLYQISEMEFILSNNKLSSDLYFSEYKNCLREAKEYQRQAAQGFMKSDKYVSVNYEMKKNSKLRASKPLPLYLAGALIPYTDEKYAYEYIKKPDDYREAVEIITHYPIEQTNNLEFLQNTLILRDHGKYYYLPPAPPDSLAP
jgi:hypothetical protein